jgi:hypothetical protein
MVMDRNWRAAVMLLLGSALGGVAGENAAPSSHLVFDDNFEGDIIINEVRVPADGEALYTYYETLGWSGTAGGYGGIQAHPRRTITSFRSGITRATPRRSRRCTAGRERSRRSSGERGPD